MRAHWDKLEKLPSLDAIRKAANKLSREHLLEMLQWNDPNAVWLDRLSMRECGTKATKKEAVDALVTLIDEGLWAENDPRRNA